MIKNFLDVISLSKKKCLLPIKGNLKYATRENFLGRIVAGYFSDATEICLLTKEAAEALCKAQNHFVENYALSLIIYDAYRPIKAVQDFIAWALMPPAGEYELMRKKIHYPKLEKNQLAKLGYIPSTISRHNYGNAVDVMLISIKDNQELPMGCPFDYFDKLSHISITVSELGEKVWNNRRILIDGMKLFDFEVYEEEFWHFDYYKREIPLPIDFDITKSLKNIGVNF